MSAREAYVRLIERVRDTNRLAATEGLLHWDQETMMPTGGESVGFRSQQLAQLAGMVHSMRVDERVPDWLEACEADGDLRADPLSPAAVNVREIRRKYDREAKLPPTLVHTFAETVAVASYEWSQAKVHNDFARFCPWLEKLVDLQRHRASCWGWPEGGEQWDALAEAYEPGMNAAGLEKLFRSLRADLVDLMQQLLESPHQPSRRFQEIELPVERQAQLVRLVVGHVGFDFTRGRLDTSAHAFCLGTNRDDVRMTVRYKLTDLQEALGSGLHEAGHAIYEQNLPGGEHGGTPLGMPVSLGVHESQARLIENHVGRSAAFWRWCGGLVREYFGSPVAEMTFDDFYAAPNRVEPALIRVGADEITYNLHIMARFDLERALIDGDLSVADLPAAWAERYQAYLGLQVPDDARGCLQDMHWAEGAMGYFPAYALGNLYAAQFFEKAEQELGDLSDRFAAGEFADLLTWLNRRIHSQGMRYTPADLCVEVTGRPLEPKPLLDHLRRKLLPLYRLA